MKIKMKYAMTMMTVALLAACGGGGNNKSFEANGRVIDGYLVDAHVFIDLNANLKHDSGEPSTYTNESGQYAFSDLKIDPTQFSVVAEVIAGKTKDLDYPSAFVSKSYVMTAPAGYSNITPITTVVAARVRSSRGTASEAKTWMAQQLDVQGIDIMSDYVASANSVPYKALRNLAVATVPVLQKTYANQAAANINIDQYKSAVLTTFQEKVSSVAGFIKSAPTPAMAADIANRLVEKRSASFSCEQFDPVDMSLSANLDLYQDITKKEVRTPTDIFFGQTAKLTGTVEGRGNSTWTFPKKPYRIRLANDAAYQAATDLFNMPKNSHWVLLANYADKSLLRNEVAFCMGKILNLNWTPRSRPVNLYANSAGYRYQGPYQLAEHVRDGASRVNLGTKVGDADFAFFVEMDGRYAAEPYWFISSMGMPMVYKFNDSAGARATAERTQTVTSINHFENVLKNGTFAELEQVVEMQSVIDMFLINELARNNDYMWSSTFFYKPYGNNKIHFGPLWDFDLAFGNTTTHGNDKPEGFWIKNQLYFIEFFKHYQFRALVYSRFLELDSKLDQMDAWITSYGNKIGQSQAFSYQRCSILSQCVWPDSANLDNHVKEVVALRQWIATRRAWLKTELSKTAAQ
jgi:hypothetical protein